MTDTPIKTRREGAILEVTLDRPKANAIDLATSRVMGETFREFRDDPELRVAILRAAGDKFFCAGWDLKEFAVEGFPESYDPEGDGALGISRRLLSKPVIAAVDGHAVAGGLELALWCDMRVMEDDAIFGVFAGAGVCRLSTGAQCACPGLLEPVMPWT